MLREADVGPVYTVGERFQGALITFDAGVSRIVRVRLRPNQGTDDGLHTRPRATPPL